MGRKMNELEAMIMATEQFKGKEFPSSEDIKKFDFGAKVLQRKVEVFKIPVKITTLAYLLLDCYAQGNPGFIQLLTLDLLDKIRDKEEKIIDTDLIANTWPWAVPEHKDYSDKWDAQKTMNGSNLVDSKEYWESFLK
jgi:hypothetical protein